MRDSSVLQFQVYRHRSYGSDTLVGGTDVVLDSIRAQEGSKGQCIVIFIPNGN